MFNELGKTWKVSWIVAVSCLVGACQDYGFEELPSSIFISRHQIQDIPLNPVDILFVVDNSGSMAGEQRQLGVSFKNFYNILNETSADYHIALVTTGLSSPGCKQCSSTNTLGCINMNLAGDSDIENGRFQYRRGHITWNGYTPEFGFTFNDTCRVVTSTNLTCFYDHNEDNPDPNNPNSIEVGRGTVLVGTNGCGYERGLEAMKIALSSDLLGGDNKGFLRDDSSLAVIIVSDENDCGTTSNVNELIGKDSFCYHAAHLLEDGTFEVSPEGYWQPLPPVENYREFLLRLKGNHTNMVKFAAIVGIKTDYDSNGKPTKIYPDETKIDFGLNDKVLEACTTPCAAADTVCNNDTLRTALPGTRYRDLYNAFGEFGFIDTICQSDFSKTMEDIAHFVACPKFFDLVEPPFNLGLANILVNGVAIPRDSWSYKSHDELLGEGVSDPPAAGRIVFENYDPCTLITQGTLRIELVYVVQ